MREENLNVGKEKISFPDKSGKIIKEIIEKYGLSQIQEEESRNIISSGLSFEKVVSAFENLPGAKIARLVKEYAEGKVFLTDLPSKLEKELGITKRDSKQIAEELKDKILVFIKPSEEKNLPREDTSVSFSTEEIPVLKTGLSEKPLEEPEDSTNDTYREPIK